MASLRYRYDEPRSNDFLLIAAGALAGLAAGVFIAQRFGGLSGLSTAVRDRLGRGGGEGGGTAVDEDEYEGEEDEIEDDGDDEAALDPGAELEERVLAAFQNDPILSERAVDIGAINDGIIELTGWVHTADEAEHARTVAGGVPGVDTVVNRLGVREEEEELEETTRRFEEGDPALTEARWEGMHVGTGRRRQGTSAELDRHADPRPELEDRWLSKEEAMRDAAEDPEEITRTRRSSRRPQKGDRTGGAPVAPTGVPKGDHVADPEHAPDTQRAD